MCLAVERPYLIGVAGGSNSGKTTIAERLAEVIGTEELTLIRLDSYYITMRDEPIAVRAAFNYDHPDAFDWDLLSQHLRRLTAGESVEVPVYDYTIYDRTDEFELVIPGKVVIVEGILVLAEVPLRKRIDIKLFVDTPPDIRFVRRLLRDVQHRGRSVESVVHQYLTNVRPMHEEFVEPSKRYADLIIPEGGENQVALDAIIARVERLVSV